VRTLYHHKTGPLVTWFPPGDDDLWAPSGQGGFLVVRDLNPEVEASWTMSRWEMFVLGLRCIGAAVMP